MITQHYLSGNTGRPINSIHNLRKKLNREWNKMISVKRLEPARGQPPT